MSAVGLPERLTGVDPAGVVRLIARDKKAVGGAARFVLLKAIAEPVTGVVVPLELQREVVSWLIDR